MAAIRLDRVEAVDERVGGKRDVVAVIVGWLKFNWTTPSPTVVQGCATARLATDPVAGAIGTVIQPRSYWTPMRDGPSAVSSTGETPNLPDSGSGSSS
ncbi:MAG TPA: hypothetical protein VF516_18335 [Kofleriaceae bacterium]